MNAGNLNVIPDARVCNDLSKSPKYTDRSKAVHLLWIIYVLCISCFRFGLLLPCGHLLRKAALLALVCDV